MDVIGVVPVYQQLKVGISPSSNGREQMDVSGTVVLVPKQLKVGISPSHNGREGMDVIGIVVLVPNQLKVRPPMGESEWM